MSVQLPSIPVAHTEFISHLQKNPDIPLRDLVAPYKQYESKLREIFAQHPEDPALKNPYVNAVPIFAGQEHTLQTRARDPASDSNDDKYIMSLEPKDRRLNGSPATVHSFKEFKQNFDLFSEQSLVDMDWSNVVVAGSAVTTSMLPVPEKHNESKRALREYYHQKLAPSSDVDLFLVGLEDEEAARKKINQIEECVRNSILAETTTIRTKHAITIASQYPVRHVQIVLRMYRSLSEIITGFDIDSSCFVYDGKQVYATPRGITAFCSQINEVDLTRRSPSYETRLAKYAHRGFEIFYPELDRSRIDPTIFERSFVRTLGLARLLLLEKLPTDTDRDNYLNQRRIERGRPQLDLAVRRMNRRQLRDNKKDDDPEDIPDWEFDGMVASYHTFTVPYGPKYHAKSIERLLFTKDMLLNAEWNKNDDRKVDLHRHPCFIGDVKSILEDCCGNCPKPTNEDERKVAEEEAKIYVSAEVGFMKDDPGRQQIGSFNPLTEHDWTDMAYLGNTQILGEAIIDGDLDAVESWIAQEGNDVNHRDHSGRMPLHLAIKCGQLDIIKILIQAGARITSRVSDGFTALHMAAAVGRADIIKVLGEKSEANEALEAEKEDKTRVKPTAASGGTQRDTEAVESQEDNFGDDGDSDGSDDDDMDDFEVSVGDSEDNVTQGSFIKVKNPESAGNEDALEDAFGPDFFDFNVLSWDAPLSPLHIAVLAGHPDCVEELVSSFGADPLLPVKFQPDRWGNGKHALLSLVLACRTATPDGPQVIKTLIDLGAKPSQSDTAMLSALHGSILEENMDAIKTMMEHDQASSKTALNFLTVKDTHHRVEASTCLCAAIQIGSEEIVHLLLDAGAKPVVAREDFSKAYLTQEQGPYVISRDLDEKSLRKKFDYVDQPVIVAARQGMTSVVKRLIEMGADVNNVDAEGGRKLNNEYSYQPAATPLDVVDRRITDSIQRLANMKPVSPHIQERMQSDSWRKILGDSQAQRNTHWPYTNRRLLVPDDARVKRFQVGAYRDSVAAQDLAIARHVRDRMNAIQKQAREGQQKDLETSRPNMEKAALEEELPQLEELREWLLALGAKTFEELHPEHKSNNNNGGYGNGGQKIYHDDEGTYKFEHRFRDSGASEREQAAYMKLFEAVWDGDLETVTAMSLKPIDDGNDERLQPLPITTCDKFGNSTLSIAIGRGHKHLLQPIIDIAHAQYRPDEQTGEEKRRRYRIRTELDDDADDDADEESDAIPITSQVVDNEFTIEDLGKLHKIVGSKVPVENFVLSSGSMRLFQKDELDAEFDIGYLDNRVSVENAIEDHVLRQWSGQSLLEYAVAKDDADLVKFLLKAAKEASALRMDVAIPGDWTTDSRTINSLEVAIAEGKMDIVEAMITLTGALLPLEVFWKQSDGPETSREKKRFYQGLKMYGKYKVDWAKQASGQRDNETPAEVKWPPLLSAIRAQGSESVKFWLSGTAPRLYNQFGESATGDERVTTLSRKSGGWSKLTSEWLELRQGLALHLAVLRGENPEDIDVFRDVLDKQGGNIDQRSGKGYTPLHLAMMKQNVEAAEALIDSGADQTLRNKQGDNILHVLLTSLQGSFNATSKHSDKEDEKTAWYEQCEYTFQLVDKRLVNQLFTERSSSYVTGVTPFAAWLHSGQGEVRLYEMLEKYMPEDVHTMYDGSGQTPVHTLLMRDQLDLLRAIIEKRPHLLGLENGNGQTPFELAQARFIQKMGSKRVQTWVAHNQFPRRRHHGLPGNDRKDEDSVYTFLRDMTRAHPDIKRKAISVNDSREIARRLADKQRESPSQHPLVQQWYERRQNGDEVDEMIRDGTGMGASSKFHQRFGRGGMFGRKSTGGRAPRKHLISRRR